MRRAQALWCDFGTQQCLHARANSCVRRKKIFTQILCRPHDGPWHWLRPSHTLSVRGWGTRQMLASSTPYNRQSFWRFLSKSFLTAKHAMLLAVLTGKKNRQKHHTATKKNYASKSHKIPTLPFFFFVCIMCSLSLTGSGCGMAHVEIIATKI